MFQSFSGRLLNHLFYYTNKNISVKPFFNLHYLSLLQLPFTRSRTAQFMEYLAVITAPNHQSYTLKKMFSPPWVSLHFDLSTSRCLKILIMPCKIPPPGTNNLLSIYFLRANFVSSRLTYNGRKSL